MQRMKLTCSVRCVQWSMAVAELTRRQLVKLRRRWNATRRAGHCSPLFRRMRFDIALPYLLQQDHQRKLYRWRERRVSTPEGKLAQWGAGPWVNEPNRIEFYAHGYPCLMRRNFMKGTWNGYVAVPAGHPNYGQWDNNLDVHGGVTYAEDHEPDTGKMSDWWWTGFDCGHVLDFAPGEVAMWREVAASVPAAALLRNQLAPFELRTSYRDAEYVRGQVEGLAAQLAAMVVAQRVDVIAEIADAMKLPRSDVRDLIGIGIGDGS